MFIRRPVVGVIAPIVILCLIPHAPAFGLDEYWAKAALTIPVGEHWRLALEERLTFGDGARRLDDYQTDFWLTYWGLVDWFGLGLGYKRTVEREDGPWLLDHRPMLNLIVRTKVRDWGLTSRSRFEYRIPQEDPESWRFRHRVTITPPVILTTLRIQPYVAQEILVDLDDGDFCQHRLYGGLYIPLHEKVRLDLFHLWKFSEHDDGSWDSAGILGSYVSWQF